MNITLIGNKIVQDTKFLAFEKNNGVDVINITVDTDESWTYKLDVKYPDKCCSCEQLYNIIDLTRNGNVCTVVLTKDMLPFNGKYIMQLRAINSDKVYHSDTFDAWVKYSIEPESTYNPVPSEFYQIEQNITEINNHPPYPDISGFWMIWNSQTNKYELSDIPAVTASDIGAIPVPATAEVGQTVVVKAVDENGKPTEWAPATLPEQVQADWNQNDSSAADYVKNRPFWESDPVETVVFEEQTANFTVGEPIDLPFIDDEATNQLYDSIWDGATVRVVWDGEIYDCVTVDGRIGGDNTPFVFSLSIPTVYALESGEHTFSITYAEADVHKIEEKYLPDTVIKSEYGAYMMLCINANLVKNIIYFSDVSNDQTYTEYCTASEWELLGSIIRNANTSFIVYASSRLVVQVSLTNKNNLIIYGSRYIDGVQKINKTNLQFDETSETLTITHYAQTL